MIVSVVNTPDFFSRAKAYESSKVFIAHEGKHILGSSARGLKNALVGGKVRRVGYGFQAFVAPEYRKMTANSSGNIRSARSGDLATLAELFNETWKNVELYEPVTSEKLSQFISRTPGYSLDKL